MVKGLGGKEKVFIVIAICPDSYKRSNNGKKNSKQSPHKLPNDPQTPIKPGGGQNHAFLNQRSVVNFKIK